MFSVHVDKGCTVLREHLFLPGAMSSPKLIHSHV